MKYLKYALLILLICVPCVVAVLIYNDKLTEDAPVFYKQGVEFYEKGDYGNAYYNFSKINKISPLYNISLFKQAKSAQNIGDYTTAAAKYKLYYIAEPKSFFTTSAKLNYAKSCYYSKQYNEALAMFTALQKSDIKTQSEALYFKGLSEKQLGKTDKAVEDFKKYIKNAFENENAHKEYIYAAAEEISSSKEMLYDEENKLTGKAYYKSGKYTKALEHFNKLPLKDSWDWVVLSNHYAGNKVEARNLIESGLMQYAKYAEEDNLKSIYNIYTSYMPGLRLKNWMTMHEIVKLYHLPSEDYILYKMADMLPKERAVIYYEKIAEEFEKGDYAPDSLSRVFFYKFSQKDYTAAEEIALRHIQLYPDAKSAPCILFWLGKTLEKENKLQDAHAVFARVVSKYPDDYYGLRAESINSKKDDFWTTTPGAKIDIKETMPDFPILLSDIDINDLKIYNKIFEASDFDIWMDADFKNPFVESWFERKKGNKSKSIVLARNELEKTQIKPPYISPSYKLAYPAHYNEEINKFSSKYNLDANFVTALVREESYFNPNAKSSTFASGLMQIMPDTATFLLAKSDKNKVTDFSLENPDTNLLLGCMYLRYLKDKFGNDLFVTAAYNGGEGSVMKWIKQFGTDDYDLFIENIPFDETRNYVKKVFRSYHMYKKIYK